MGQQDLIICDRSCCQPTTHGHCHHTCLSRVRDVGNTNITRVYTLNGIVALCAG